MFTIDNPPVVMSQIKVFRLILPVFSQMKSKINLCIFFSFVKLLSGRQNIDKVYKSFEIARVQIIHLFPKSVNFQIVSPYHDKSSSSFYYNVLPYHGIHLIALFVTLVHGALQIRSSYLLTICIQFY